MLESSTVGLAAAHVLGLAFGFGWMPCIGPVLRAILTVSAVQTTVSGGIALLSFFWLLQTFPAFGRIG